MMKINFLACLALGLLLAACKKENALESSGVKSNYFAVPDGAADPESVLRRNFFEMEKTYLLFTDTLRKEYLGKDVYGDDSWFVERVNIDYSISNVGDIGRVTKLKDMEQKNKAVDFVKSNFLSRLGQPLRPYSFLLTDSYDIYDSYDEAWKLYNVKSGIRCIALSLGAVIQKSPAEQRVYVNEVLFEIVKAALVKQQASVLSAFYAFSNTYYSADKTDDLGWPYVLNNQKVREVGFLKDVSRYYLPAKQVDLEAYLKEVLTVKPEVFAKDYAAYPLLLAKYNKLSEIVTFLGYKL